MSGLYPYPKLTFLFQEKAKMNNTKTTDAAIAHGKKYAYFA